MLGVFYSDDAMWHEQLVLWQRSPNAWYILAPDGDLHAEDLSMLGVDGPSKIKVKGIDFKYWSRVGGTAYKFASPVKTDDELRSYIRQAYREALTEDGFDGAWRPMHVQDSSGKLVDFESFLGNSLNPRRRARAGRLSVRLQQVMTLLQWSC